MVSIPILDTPDWQGANPQTYILQTATVTFTDGIHSVYQLVVGVVGKSIYCVRATIQLANAGFTETTKIQSTSGTVVATWIENANATNTVDLLGIILPVGDGVNVVTTAVNMPNKESLSLLYYLV